MFNANDVLILQASDDSPLLRLKPPSQDYYKKLAEEASRLGEARPSTFSGPKPVKTLVNLVTGRQSFTDLAGLSKKSSQNDLSMSSELSRNRSTDKLPDVESNTDGFYIPSESNVTEAEDAEIAAQPSGIEMVRSNLCLVLCFA